MSESTQADCDIPFITLLDNVEQTVTVRPPKRPAPTSERAKVRLIRQKIFEQEQEQEDREALGITPDEFKILQASFASVKTEFSDLDGLSWDTPLAREILLNWHAQQAARQHHSRANPGGLQRRHSRTRRSLASIASPSNQTVSATSRSHQSTTVFPQDEDGDPSDDEAVRIRPMTPVPLGLDLDDDDNLKRTPLPSLFLEDRFDKRTPRPSLCGDGYGADQDNDSEPPTPGPFRPRMPKSRSAPSVFSLPHEGSTVESPSRLPRLVKTFPASRIPKAMANNRSFSAKAMPSLATFMSDPVFAFTAPTSTSRASGSGSPPVSRTSSYRAQGRERVLSDSSKLNQDPESNDDDVDPALNCSTSSIDTIRPSTSPTTKHAMPSAAVMLSRSLSTLPPKIKWKATDTKGDSRVFIAPARSKSGSTAVDKKPARPVGAKAVVSHGSPPSPRSASPLVVPGKTNGKGHPSRSATRSRVQVRPKTGQ